MTVPSVAGDAPHGQDRLWRFIAYYGVSEMAQRGTRLVTTAILARVLMPMDFGVAAIAITCFELIRVTANAGIGQAVIRTADDRLAGTCLTAHRLMWLLCGVLFVLQCLAGAIIAVWTGRPDVFLMIVALACVYLTMPPAVIQAFLLQRANGHRAIAGIATAQAIADNIFTIVLALLGAGPWAIVLPKLLTTPIWTFGMRRALAWKPDRAAKPAPSHELLEFALPVLGVDIVMAARLQLDKVIVASILGVEALGIYYFVFNAGIGVSLALTTALSNSLYPYFAVAAHQPGLLLSRLDSSMLRKALPIAGIILAQAVAAPFYVPLIFGAKWAGDVSWMVAILCATASCKAFADTGAQALRAGGAARFEFGATVAVTAASLASLAVGLQFGLGAGVVALALVSGGTQLLFALVARNRIRARFAAATRLSPQPAA